MGPKTILVFDDDPAMLELFELALRGRGYAVHAVGDGPPGLAWFDEHADEVGAVIIDRMLPSTTGEEVLAALRRRDPTVPVLMTSGYSGAATEAAMARLGANGFLGKPFKLSTLMSAVGELMEPTPPE